RCRNSTSATRISARCPTSCCGPAASIPRAGRRTSWAEREGAKEIMKYQSQRVALAYIWVALILFAVQVSMGLVIGYIYVEPNFLSEVLPFSIARMLHTNSLIVWLLTGFFGAAYFLIPEEAEREIHSVKAAYIQL